MSPREWRSLDDSDRNDLISAEAKIGREIDQLAESLNAQKAYTPEVATVASLAKLGLL